MLLFSQLQLLKVEGVAGDGSGCLFHMFIILNLCCALYASDVLANQTTAAAEAANPLPPTPMWCEALRAVPNPKPVNTANEMEMAAAVAIVCVCVCMRVCVRVHVCVRFSVRVYGICCVNGFLGLPRAQNEPRMKGEKEAKRGLGLLTEIFQFTCIRTTVINNKALEKGQRKALKMSTKWVQQNGN